MEIRIPFILSSSIPEDALLLPIACNNWKKEFPYEPKTSVKLWHNGESLFLNFKVEEEEAAAMVSEDNGRVCQDSCVEFFISFDNNGYYNLETNCIGKVLLSHRRGRKIDVEYASPEILAGIKRVSSLGSSPFECRKMNGPWTMTLEIPIKSFFKHSYESYNGLKAKCNIYKCGDALPKPHFLSWKPIKAENPDFHLPNFFSPISF